MAHRFDLKEIAVKAGIPLVAINGAGYLEPKIEGYLSGTTNTGFLNMLNSNAAVNKGGAAAAKNAKWYKVLLYNAAGVASVALADTYMKGKTGEMAGEALGTFFMGLGGATIAQDPVLNVPSPVYTAAAQTTLTAAPARQVTVRTANVIS